ncbi:MAG TPA: thioredoxin family protein [Candidatus Limnocylindrales bacterium]
MTALPAIEIEDRPSLAVGARAPDFEGLLGVDGHSYALADFAHREIVVLIFSSNRCPTAKAYTQRMNDLQASYGGRGVQLIAINSNSPYLYPEESYARMIELAHEAGYTFPYLNDDGQRLARAYGPTKTFHVFVLDAARRLRYPGRFDDARVAANVRTSDLADALDDILADREVRVPVTRAFGCSLDLM